MKKLRTLKALIKPGSTKKDSVSIPSALDVLLATPIWIKDEEARVSMTISCRDSDYIPKIKNAGAITSRGGQQVQIMHNGLRVVVGGYHGEWMSRIIRELKGHHEPQEEKVFHEILKQLDDSAVMIELGAFWSYYSIWFNKT
ncbi:MAG: hypothetical protein ACREGF_00910, partial [Candidatus Saccharimonadales bacterium]